MTEILQLDARNMACPKPVLQVKSVIDSGHKGPVTIILNDEASAINVTTFMEGVGLLTKRFQEGAEWLVLGQPQNSPEILISKDSKGWHANVDKNIQPAEGIIELTIPASPDLDIIDLLPEQQQSEEEAKKIITALMVPGRYMGRGDDVLGAKLAANFFDTLAALKEPPQICAFYNNGVFLTTTESPIIPALKDLVEQGSTIISCGVCLDFFDLKEKLLVGRIGNMYEIICAQKNADRLLTM